MKLYYVTILTLLIVFMSGATSSLACTVTIPTSFLLDLTEGQINNAASGTNITNSATQNIIVSDCIQNTGIAIRSSNTAVHPFSIDSTRDLATGVNAITVRLDSSTEKIILNDVSGQATTTGADGSISFPLSVSVWRTSQPYNNEAFFTSTIDLQLEEI